MINKTSRILGIIVLILGLLAISSGLKAQNVVLKGNTFVQVSKNTEDKKTEFTYQAKDGKKYPIYLSAKGKAYIIVTSKSGKEYRRYLPDITEKLNKMKDGRRND